MFCDGWVKCGVFSNDPAVQVIILALLQSVIGQESLKYFPEISFKYPQKRLDLLNNGFVFVNDTLTQPEFSIFL